jgi:hypothetical protein
VGDKYNQWHNDKNYYVFVRYYNENFEAFLESSENVIQHVNESIDRSRKRSGKDWVPCWHLPQTSLPVQKLQWQMLSKFKQLQIKK